MEKKSKREKFLFLLALSISAAVFCGIWTALAPFAGLIGWAGFAGCTTYFSTGSHGFKGLRRTILPNLAGIACGVAIIALNGVTPFLESWGIWCAVITFVMCIVTYFELLDFCPGLFMGCFCTFAAGGDWMHLAPSIVLGAVLGWLCEYGGTVLYQKFFKK